MDTSLRSILRSLGGIVLEVLTIRQDDDRFSQILAIGEGLTSKHNSLTNSRPLVREHIGRNIGEEVLSCSDVRSDRELNKGASRKDDQSHTVRAHILQEAGDRALSKVQSAGSDVLTKHGVRDIEADHRFDTLVICPLVATTRQLWTSQDDDHECTCDEEQEVT